jgi:hypothetical protein
MALVDVIRGGVAIAASILASVKGDVVHQAWTGQDGKGTDTYASPVTLKAIVDRTRKQKFTTTGKLVTVAATLTFIDPIADTTATDPAMPRNNPIDPRDLLTLSDGTTGPILSVGGVEDAGTQRGFINEVTIGDINQDFSNNGV